MKMKKEYYYCDVCGASTQKKVRRFLLRNIFEFIVGFELSEGNFHICDNCQKSFGKWLKWRKKMHKSKMQMTIEQEKLAKENEKNILKIIEEMERTLKGIDKIFSFFFWCFLG